jgi:hypothetical protein
MLISNILYRNNDDVKDEKMMILQYGYGGEYRVIAVMVNGQKANQKKCRKSFFSVKIYTILHAFSRCDLFRTAHYLVGVFRAI